MMQEREFERVRLLRVLLLSVKTQICADMVYVISSCMLFYCVPYSCWFRSRQSRGLGLIIVTARANLSPSAHVSGSYVRIALATCAHTVTQSRRAGSLMSLDTCLPDRPIDDRLSWLSFPPIARSLCGPL